MYVLSRFVRVLCCLVLCTTPGHAAQWARTFGGVFYDWAESVQPIADGGYIVSGTNGCLGPEGCSAWVLRLDRAGNIAWQKTYGDGIASSIALTKDGAYIAAGTMNPVNGAGGDEASLLNLNPSGNVVWAKVYGGPSNDRAYSVRQTLDGGYAIAGETRSFGAGGSDAWVLKLDASGSVIWQRTFGGEEDDSARAIEQTPDGGYVITGTTRSFAAGGSDAWVLKLDAAGNVRWQYTYGAYGNEYAYSIHTTLDGGYVVAGETTSFSAGFPRAWVFKLDAIGNLAWQKTFGAEDYEYSAYSVQPTADSGYVVSGRAGSLRAFSYSAWVLKLDAGGNVIWQSTLGSAGVNFFNTANAVQPTADGGYVAVGWSQAAALGAPQALVFKLNSNGGIAGCADLGPSNATAMDSNAIKGFSTATVGLSSTIATDVMIEPIDSTISQQTQCLYATPVAAPADIPTLTEQARLLLAFLLVAGAALALRYRNLR